MDNLEHLKKEFTTLRLGTLLEELVFITAKLANSPYPYDRDGKLDFEADLELASSKAIQAYGEYKDGGGK